MRNQVADCNGSIDALVESCSPCPKRCLYWPEHVNAAVYNHGGEDHPEWNPNPIERWHNNDCALAPDPCCCGDHNCEASCWRACAVWSCPFLCASAFCCLKYNQDAPEFCNKIAVPICSDLACLALYCTCCGMYTSACLGGVSWCGPSTHGGAAAAPTCCPGPLPSHIFPVEMQSAKLCLQHFHETIGPCLSQALTWTWLSCASHRTCRMVLGQGTPGADLGFLWPDDVAAHNSDASGIGAAVHDGAEQGAANQEAELLSHRRRPLQEMAKQRCSCDFCLINADGTVENCCEPYDDCLYACGKLPCWETCRTAFAEALAASPAHVSPSSSGGGSGTTTSMSATNSGQTLGGTEEQQLLGSSASSSSAPGAPPSSTSQLCSSLLDSLRCCMGQGQIYEEQDVELHQSLQNSDELRHEEISKNAGREGHVEQEIERELSPPEDPFGEKLNALAKRFLALLLERPKVPVQEFSIVQDWINIDGINGRRFCQPSSTAHGAADEASAESEVRRGSTSTTVGGARSRRSSSSQIFPRAATFLAAAPLAQTMVAVAGGSGSGAPAYSSLHTPSPQHVQYLHGSTASTEEDIEAPAGALAFPPPVRRSAASSRPVVLRRPWLCPPPVHNYKLFKDQYALNLIDDLHFAVLYVKARKEEGEL